MPGSALAASPNASTKSADFPVWHRRFRASFRAELPNKVRDLAHGSSSISSKTLSKRSVALRPHIEPAS
jgi:hypothetical protein